MIRASPFIGLCWIGSTLSLSLSQQLTNLSAMRLVETETSLAPSTCDGMIHHTAKQFRSCSFDLDEVKTLSNQLSEIVRSSNVYLGGSAVGKGLHKAVQRYLRDGGNDEGKYRYNLLDLPGAADLSEGCQVPPEDAFYIVDIGILVSQVYQWRRFFPRVEPFYAVKCNPDPVIVKTLAVLGCNFDCASRNEIQLVQELTKVSHSIHPSIITHTHICTKTSNALRAHS